MGVVASSIGLLIPAHNVLLANVTIFSGEEIFTSSRLDHASTLSFLRVGLLSRKFGEGSRTGAAGTRYGVR